MCVDDFQFTFMFNVLLICAGLYSVWVQSRGFKTLRSKTRRTESSYEGPVESEPYTPAFMKVRIMGVIWDRVVVVKYWSGWWRRVNNKSTDPLSLCFHLRGYFTGKRDQRYIHWTNCWNRRMSQTLSRRLSRQVSLKASCGLRPTLREHKACVEMLVASGFI